MQRFLTTTAIAAIPFLSATIASADCSAVSGIAAGQTVTCDAVSVLDGADAVETREIDTSSDTVTIDVLTGAEIDTTAIADRAIQLRDSAFSTVTNAGKITSGDEGIQAGEGLTVVNSGTLEAVEKGIDANGAGFQLTNTATGRITSLTNEGVEAEDDAIINNEGLIQGFDDALQVGQNAVIENYGTIENTQTAADLAADPGLEAQDAIDIDSGMIYNEGTIRSAVNAAIDFDPGLTGSEIHNHGLISGTVAIGVDVDDLAGQSVFNAGILEGIDGTALSLGEGADMLVSFAGSQMIGGADFGAGADRMVFDAGFFDDAPSLFAAGNLLDGGTGFDTIEFTGVSLADVLGVPTANGGLVLSIFGAAGETELMLTSWESFVFSDGTMAYGDFVAPVPLPAGAVLIGTALAGLGLAGRRRARS